MEVVIDGVTYVPRAEVPPITDQRLLECLRELTAIQHFHGQTHKHRVWAWDALHALSPELAELSSNNPEAAFTRVRPQEEARK